MDAFREFAFKEFWSAYPKKVAKVRCQNIWDEKISGVYHKAIIAHVKAMRRLDPEWLAGFAPHPSTYLNQERWFDPMPQESRVRDTTKDDGTICPVCHAHKKSATHFDQCVKP